LVCPEEFDIPFTIGFRIIFNAIDGVAKWWLGFAWLWINRVSVSLATLFWDNFLKQGFLGGNELGINCADAHSCEIVTFK
jgi:hypothetical protein